MKNLNGDEKIEYLRDKIKKGISLTEEEILTLTFLPLMDSTKSKSDRTKVINIMNKILLKNKQELSIRKTTRDDAEKVIDYMKHVGSETKLRRLPLNIYI